MRKQRAFASLTDQELDQIAEWLIGATYDEVRERVAKPRPEGFNLEISNRPLQTLWANKIKVDKVNKLLNENKKLTLSEFDAINGGERDDVTDEVHHAIMETTYDLATSGDNTPAQLLALQRLADFPARAEYRAHRKELDTQMRSHKIEMDSHRRKMSEERLDLSKRSLALRESQIAARSDQTKSAFRNGQSGSDPHSAIPSDDLGPYAATLDEIEERARRKFGLPFPNRRPARRDEEAPEETSAGLPPTSPATPEKIQEDPSSLTPNDSAEAAGRNAFHRVPNISPSNLNPCSSAPSDMVEPDASGATEPACNIVGHVPSRGESQTDAEPPSVVHDPSSSPSCSSSPLSASTNPASSNPHLDSRQRTSLMGNNIEAGLGTPFAPRIPKPESPPIQSGYSDPQCGVDSKIASHAIRRWRSFLPRRYHEPELDNSWTEECPCGAQLPCDLHTGLWIEVRYLRPSDPEYAAALTRHGVPVYVPKPEELQVQPQSQPTGATANELLALRGHT